MQFAENLTDRQAADAVRSRIDWKYVLGLDLTDPGFHYSVLSEFRTRLIEEKAEHLLLETMLTHFRANGMIRARGRQRTDSTHVLAALRILNRLELVAETLMHTLNILATVAPDWLKAWVPNEWFSRYAERLDEYHLPHEKQDRLDFAQLMGTDGGQLLSMVYSEAAPRWLSALPAVNIMRRVWCQQFYVEAGRVQWRTPQSFGVPPASLMISSPHEIEARYSTKRDTTHWVGYKAHLTESCDPDCPHLITNVQTTPATGSGNHVTAKIHQELEQQGLLPREHLLDRGYGSIDLFLKSRQQYDIDLVCPVRPDNSWQARTEGAYDISQFKIDWDRCQVICPQGKTSRYWKEGQRRGRSKILVLFDPQDCHVCPTRAQCTRNRGTQGHPGSRELTLGPRKEHEAMQQARELQQMKTFLAQYAKREGVEGTISQAAYALSMRRCRYRGLVKTHLQHVLTACAINLTRVVDWLGGKPRARTRVSPFVALAT
jgi:transposase